MKDPTKVKTPEATGAELVERETGEIIPAQVPYSELDKLVEDTEFVYYYIMPTKNARARR
jgi:hypothetical protein